MAPSRSSKKRQSSTLHDFFGPHAPLKRPTVNNNNTNKTKTSNRPVEIIIIDSDDENQSSLKTRRTPLPNKSTRSERRDDDDDDDIIICSASHYSTTPATDVQGESTVHHKPLSKTYHFGEPSTLAPSTFPSLSLNNPSENSVLFSSLNSTSASTSTTSGTSVQSIALLNASPPLVQNETIASNDNSIGLSSHDSESMIDESMVWNIMDDDEVAAGVGGVGQSDDSDPGQVSPPTPSTSTDSTIPTPNNITISSKQQQQLCSRPTLECSSSSKTHSTKVAGNQGTQKVNNNNIHNNAFSVLMALNYDEAAWREAEGVEDRGARSSHPGRRKTPFYKVLQGMPIAVDAFRYGSIPGVTAYFLTHAHSDHYTNLSSNWKHGPIYASETTAKLIIHMLGVDTRWVRPLPMNQRCLIPDSGGVEVTLIDANHCPGSCLFFFEGKQTIIDDAGESAYKSPHVGTNRVFRYLHCGDFRASPQHVLHPEVRGKRIDCVYLDTTYLDPKYTFPPQALVVSACADLAQQINSRGDGVKNTPCITDWMPNSKPKAKPGRLLVIVGTYTIGKERIVKAIAQALSTKIYCDARKAAILRCQPDDELESLLTDDPLAAQVHILPLGMITCDKLKLYAEGFHGEFSRVVGFRPTGWSFHSATSTMDPSIASVIASCQKQTFNSTNLQPGRNSTATLQVYSVPYSEHSSFFELSTFALSLNWVRMIATVNVGTEKSRANIFKWVERWQRERQRRGGTESVIIPYRNAEYW